MFHVRVLFENSPFRMRISSCSLFDDKLELRKLGENKKTWKKIQPSCRKFAGLRIERELEFLGRKNDYVWLVNFDENCCLLTEEAC